MKVQRITLCKLKFIYLFIYFFIISSLKSKKKKLVVTSFYYSVQELWLRDAWKLICIDQASSAISHSRENSKMFNSLIRIILISELFSKKIISEKFELF